MNNNKLYTFLIVTGIYDEYIDTIKSGNITASYRQCNEPSIDDIFKHYSNNAIALDFLWWNKTIHGHDFWEGYYYLFKGYLKYKKNK